ncbi:MAG: hypothetical protein ACYDCL_01525 [Myxococcales bacterium]
MNPRRMGIVALVVAACACSGPARSPDAGTGPASGTGSSGVGASSAASSGTGCGSACGTTGSPSSGSTATTGGHGTGSSGATLGSNSGSGSAAISGMGSGGTTGSQGSSGGTGGSCASLGSGCERVDCCSGATCDLGSGKCVALACGNAGAPCSASSDCCTGLVCDGLNCGPPCAGAGQSCAGEACCIGLTCYVEGPKTQTCGLPPDGGCAPSPLGGPCTTLADCQSGLVCAPAGDAGSSCTTPIPPSPSCLAVGQACAPAGEPCCGGRCAGGLCAPFAPCALAGASCSVDGDCCNGLGCDAGGCRPLCGGEWAACNPANGSADCCTAQGLTCVPTGFADGGPAAVCTHAQFVGGSGQPLDCGGPCTGFPCALGTTCQPPTGTGTDPCAGAGLVCDLTYDVCRQPGEFETCQPGGPACQPIAGSTIGLSCLAFGGYQLCLQPCTPSDPASGSSDCVDPLTVCTSLGTGSGHACYYDYGDGACANGAPFFGVCNAEGIGDGVCFPYSEGSTTFGFCLQATLDGGAPGESCLMEGNRQQGGLCSPAALCVGGICDAPCNAGTGLVPACAPSDGGAAAECVPIYGQTGNASDIGSCSPSCDFAAPDGGGCPSSGSPSKCVPELYFTGRDNGAGVCVQASEAPSAVGQPCGGSSDFVDGCVAGALCMGDPFVGGPLCVQLCHAVGSIGQAPCLPGSTCAPLQPGSTLTGYCASLDGGL